MVRFDSKILHSRLNFDLRNKLKAIKPKKIIYISFHEIVCNEHTKNLIRFLIRTVQNLSKYDSSKIIVKPK